MGEASCISQYMPIVAQRACWAVEEFDDATAHVHGVEYKAIKTLLASLALRELCFKGVVALLQGVQLLEQGAQLRGRAYLHPALYLTAQL
ncbi:hypothetical protein [Pseudomonas sp. 02C 26]|uniref:hypothetical protein n=1 Tax=Pseudomonas sp. 02C 26 TaxID=2054914 RepID=UPI0012FF1385|nr:hypothetical protein [Pseudomonas sp. 02C 26]